MDVVLTVSFKDDVLFFTSALISSLGREGVSVCNGRGVVVYGLNGRAISILGSSRLVNRCNLSCVANCTYGSASNAGGNITVTELSSGKLSFTDVGLLRNGCPRTSNRLLLRGSSLLHLKLSSTGVNSGVALGICAPGKRGSCLRTPVRRAFALYNVTRGGFAGVSGKCSVEGSGLRSNCICDNTRTTPKKGRGLTLCAGFSCKDEGGSCSGCSGLRSLLDGGNNSSSEVVALPSSFLSALSSCSRKGDSVIRAITLTTLLTTILVITSYIKVIGTFNAGLGSEGRRVNVLHAINTAGQRVVDVCNERSAVLALVYIPTDLTISFFTIGKVVSLLNGGFMFVPGFKILTTNKMFDVVYILVTTFVPLSSTAQVSPIRSVESIRGAHGIGAGRVGAGGDFGATDLLTRESVLFGEGGRINMDLFLTVAIFVSYVNFS